MGRKLEDRSWLFRLDAHHRLIAALVISGVTFTCVNSRCTASEAALLTWLAFSAAIILTSWLSILSAHPRDVRRVAKLEDSSRTFIFLFVIAASIISLAAVVFLLKAPKQVNPEAFAGHVMLAIGVVALSWWLVHTVFAIRYAHMYYEPTNKEGTASHVGGLSFPGNIQPDYLDFVYFSFVIGMTFQVSDVEITSRSIRRLAWLHGLVSFMFNTAIVALSINIVSGLISSK